MRYTDKHRYSKYSVASYVNYRNEDVIKYLQKEFPDETFKLLERNDNDIVIMDETRKEIIVAFRGTQQTSDWFEENSRIAFDPNANTKTKRFKTALALTEKYKEMYPDYEVKTTGHSMGAFIAMAIAQMLDLESHVYDPAVAPWNAKQDKGDIFIYRPKSGGIVSAKSYLLKGKKNVTIKEENVIKEAKTVVDFHDLEKMYDDRVTDRHKGIRNHFHFLNALLNDVSTVTSVFQYPQFALTKLASNTLSQHTKPKHSEVSHHKKHNNIIFHTGYKGISSFTEYRTKVPNNIKLGGLVIDLGYDSPIQDTSYLSEMLNIIHEGQNHKIYKDMYNKNTKHFGYALENEKIGHITILGGVGDKIDPILIQKIINGKNIQDASELNLSEYNDRWLFNESQDVLYEMIENMHADGINEIELSTHSLGGYKGRVFLPKIAEAFPNIEFKLNILNGHLRSPKDLPNIPDNLKIEYHTINTDMSNLKDHNFRKVETQRGAKFIEYPAIDPSMKDNLNHDITEFYHNKPKTKIPSTLINAADFTYGLGVGIAADYIAPDKEGIKHDAEALGIGASMYGGGKGLLQATGQFVKGGMNAEAASAGAVAGAGVAATSAGAFFVGGLAGYGTSNATNYVLDKAGVENEDIKDPISSTAGGAAAGAATGLLFAPETFGLSVAIGAGIGATIGGIEDLWRHRKDISHFFNRHHH